MIRRAETDSDSNQVSSAGLVAVLALWETDRGLVALLTTMVTVVGVLVLSARRRRG